LSQIINKKTKKTMKKLMIIAAVLMGNIAFSYSEAGEPINKVTIDSSENEIHFNIESTNSNLLNVWVKGVEEDFTSIALIDQRGKTLYYQYVKTDNDTFEINLEDLAPGKYYVKLNMDSEIRMKTVIIG
jgi:plastocyanin